MVRLLEIIDEAGGRADLRNLEEGLEADLTVLPSVLVAVRQLVLVMSAKGGFLPTELGSRFLMAPTDRPNVLKRAMEIMESFRTALELPSKDGGVSSNHLAEVLRVRGTEWDYREDESRKIVHNQLLSWAIPSGLLTYEKTKFRMNGH